MSYRTLYIIFITAFTLSLASVYAISVEPEKADNQKSLGIIKVGCLLPLTGKYESLGNGALRGVLAAIDAVKKSNYNIQVVIKDFEEDPVKLKKALYELVNEDNISLLIGPLPSSFAKDVYTTISTLKIPTLIFPVSNDLAPENPYFIKFSFPIDVQTQILVNYSNSVVNVDTYGVLYPDTTIGELFKNSFVRIVKSTGKEIKHVAAYNTDLSDIDTEIEWLSLVAPQGIFIPDTASRSREIILKLKNKLYIGNTIFLGINTWNSGSFMKELGNKIDADIFRVLFTDYFYPGSKSWVDFNNLFKSSMGQDPGFLEFQVYLGSKYVIEKLIESRASVSVLLTNVLNKGRNDDLNISKTQYGTIEIYPKPILLTIKEGEIIKIM